GCSSVYLIGGGARRRKCRMQCPRKDSKAVPTAASRLEVVMLRVTTQLSNHKALESWLRPPPYIMNEEMRRRNFEARAFAGWPGAGMGTGRLTPVQEIVLFKQLHFSAYRLSKIYRAAHKKHTVALKKQYGMWVQRYNQIRARLIEGNLGLVYDLIGRSR